MTIHLDRLKDNETFLSHNIAQNNQHKNINSPQKKYRDPLLEWPVRGLAFSNDIGAAIMDISPKLGTMFWVPALMYFGADIYDKYKNDKDSYNPNPGRGLKQAVFQACASILFPIVAVHAGQKAFSIGTRFLGKDKLSLQTQEEIIQHHKDFASHRKLREYTIDEYKAQYSKALDNYIDETSRTNKTKNPIKKLFNAIFGSKHYEELGNAKREKIHEYINKRIDKMFEFRELLLENKKPEKLSSKLFTQYQELKESYKKSPKHEASHVDNAIKDTLKAFENKKIFNLKLIKTLGGFVALGLLIKPIDKFVDKIIIEKLVGPSLDKFDRERIDGFKSKFLKPEVTENK